MDAAEKKKKRPASPPPRNPSGPSSPGKGVSPDNSVSEPLFPGGIETLLETASRKPLPQIPQQKGRKCLLYDIVLHAPKLYAKMIGQLRMGVSPEVAAEVCGIGERTFYEWAQRGRLDLDRLNESGEPDPLDSFFSRFYLDVRRAIATQAADCEIKLAEIDPKRWLTVGPGRIFGQKWAKDKATGGSPPHASLPSPAEDVIDATFTVNHGDPNGRAAVTDNPAGNPAALPPGRSVGTAGSQTPLQISVAQELETLEVLEEIGMLQLNDSIRKAYQQQLGIEEDN